MLTLLKPNLVQFMEGKQDKQTFHHDKCAQHREFAVEDSARVKTHGSQVLLSRYVVLADI